MKTIISLSFTFSVTENHFLSDTRTSVTVISDLSVYVLRFLAEKSVFLHNYDLKLNEIRMEERRVADYFVVAGLPKNPLPLGDFSCDGAPLKSTHNLPPITDITVINRSLGEVTPDGYFCIELTPSGLVANLNHGALRSPEMFLCYRRGRDKQPLVDIGVLYEGRERVMADSQIVEFTHGGRNANINPSGQTTYMTYRRASDTAACNELVVSDICVIMTNRGDQAPHSYCTIDRNLNKGTVVGSDIYVCYKKSMNRSNYIAYRAGIMDSFPFHHHPDFPIPTDLALFCLPMGATLESWPARASLPQPVFSTFVLTVTAGEGNTEAVEKVYGAAISFYEKYSHDRLTQEQRESLKLDEHFGWHNIVHTNKCICILSRWPFFDTFEKFLRYLHHMAIGGSYSVPIERYIYHFVESVPFPSARRPRILIQLDATERISLAQPEDSPISLSGAKFRQLVMTLRPEGCLLVLLFALTEQKILLHSLRPDVLTAVAEAITMIIFPFHWQCPYVPLCPLGLSDFLNAPIPFLLGLDSRFFDLYDPPTDVICIDLDTGAMSVPEDKRHLVTKILPRRATRTLRATLENLCEKIHKFEKSLQQHLKSQKNEPDSSIDSDFKMKRKEQQLDVEIQEAFLRFTATILKGYSNYLLPIVSAKAGAACDTSSLFDLDAFVKSRDRAYHKFYQLLVNTQLFSKFIEERSFVSDKDASLAFFDDCAEKVTEDDTTLRLLEVEATQSEHTMFLPPPEPIYLPEGVLYSYKDFPKLNPELFPTEEPKPALPAQVKQPQATPASPLARRTKHEVKSAQKLASRHAQTPILWAKCLLSSCYSLWFTQLPAFASTQHHKARFLQLAFRILTNMQKLNLSQADEVSYRVMMQLCGQYSQPILAVKVLCEMRQHGITPNAITYGYYNRAVMENKWTHSNLFWKKLRNVVIGVSAFKQSGLERAQRRKSSLSLDEVDKCLTDADSASRVSLESGASIDSHPPAPHAKTDTLSSDPGYCSVSETSESVSSPGAPPTAVSSSAGLLMSSALNNTVFDAASRNRQRPSDLADALSPTLDQYDKMSEATAVRTSPEVQTPIAQEKVVPEYLRSDSYGNDAKIITNLLRLTKVEIEPLAQVYQIRTSSSPVSAEDIQSSLEDQKAALADLKNADLLSRSNDSLSDISEEETPSRAGVVRGFFSRNAPERLSNLFKRSVDSADEKLRGFWKRSGSVSRSSSKDSVNLEQGVSDYLEGGRESSAEKSSGDRSSTERSSVEKDGDTDLICMKKTPEPPVALDKAEQKPETPTSMKPQSLLFPPRSPNINIDRTHNYSPIPSSPIRTPVTENDPLGAFSPQSTEEADPKAGLSSYSSMTASVVSESTSSTRESPSRHSSASDDSELVAHLSGHRGHRRSNRQVARSATFTGRTSQDPVRRFQRSSNSLWALSSSPSPTHSSSPQPSRTLPSDHTQSDDSNSALMSATPTWPSLKLPFSYSNSSSRLGMASNMASVGLRQATKQIEQLRAQYIDPAMADLGQYSMNSYALSFFIPKMKRLQNMAIEGPGNFNYRKNELISGGLSSMKSAVTSLSKKYNEIRDAITATNVPTRSGLPSSRMGEGEGDEDSLDGFWSRRESADVPGLAPLDDPGGIPIGASGGLNESDAISTQQDLFPPLGWDPQGPFCLGIWLTSCTRCHNCAALLYDEEIMAGWRPDDSNLNTKCTFCERMTVPLLTIIIYDLRHEPRPAKQAEDLSSESGKSTPAPPGANSDATDKGAPTEDTSKEEPRPESLLKDGVGILLQKKGVRCEPITIPYLSPLVLRKELETVLSHEGDVCLNNTDFTDHHPILYWNLLWYFCRLRVPSHLPGLCLTAASVTRDRTPHPSWEGADWQNVYIKCLWDNTKYHEELGQPMYIQWQQDKQPSQLVSALVRERTKVPRDVMQSVITAIHMDDLSTAMKLMLQELRKRPSNLRRNHFPIYRDLLFLAFSCIPPAQLNLTSFDREYRRAYERNEQANSKLLSRSDAPPPIAAVFCRRYFSQLSL
ncbi:DENN domain-containing protein Crag isoform X5 [Macrobrachium rosenbergii]|uniref:DENN domain-containing protein Crag isoform X5 n=1 Tax=Macrobrachium rosenbergii TaxID=79674 RepID=UPI0034D70EE4